jgi:putative iron-regulated protein
MNTLKTFGGVILGASLLWTACTKPTTDPNADLKTNVVSNYCDIVAASYTDAHAKAVELQTAINTLVATPTQANFDAAKSAWKASREPYGQTESYRFYDGPIDDSDGPEGALNAWPLDENYVDYTRDAAGTGIVQSGIINDVTGFPTISATVLANANEQGGEKNISIGYHAIEFLLWGQDYLDVNINPGQGGNRAYTDYTSSANNHTRRGEYIKACAELLVMDLAMLKSEWMTGGGYRTYFEGLTTDEAIAKILTGAGVLSRSELSGERMFVALEANPTDNPQEDEHSCFADNTNRDIITNAQGITNVLVGTYTKTDGTKVGNTAYSILTLVAAVDNTVATELTTLNATAMAKVNAIPAPFDKTVTEENKNDNGPVLQAVQALQDQGDKIAEAATALGLSISTDLPD